MKKISLVLVLMLTLSCNQSVEELTIETVVEDYVRLVLEIGQYNTSFVDAYFGPEEWKPTAEVAEVFPKDNFVDRSNHLIEQCETLLKSKDPETNSARINMLKKQLIAVRTKVQMIAGETFSFDKEAELLYDAAPPHFDNLLLELENLLKGEGTLTDRYNAYMTKFVIPKEKLNDVFRVAIDASRKITSTKFNLPQGENFVLEYVTDKVWSGYNYYQGNSQSLIQINTDFPIYISRAVDLASHEGYPGHHVYMMLIEQNLVNAKGWKEFSVYPLFSPLSLISEGSANYGIDVVFPGDKRIEFEKERLFPIAGIDVSEADKFYKVQGLLGKLNYARNETARDYLDGEISREEAIAQIMKYSLFSYEKAEQSVRFIETNRSYVINYNLGKDMVSKHVKLTMGADNSQDNRWNVFKNLLSNPYTASTLRQE